MQQCKPELSQTYECRKWQAGSLKAHSKPRTFFETILCFQKCIFLKRIDPDLICRRIHQYSLQHSSSIQETCVCTKLTMQYRMGICSFYYLAIKNIIQCFASKTKCLLYWICNNMPPIALNESTMFLILDKYKKSFLTTRHQLQDRHVFTHQLLIVMLYISIN